MNKRNKIIIVLIAVIAIIILFLIFLWWFANRPKPSVMVNINQGVEVPAGLPTASVNANGNILPVDQSDVEAEIRSAAMSFSERFGSYSSQNNFSNLDALSDLMTLKMKAWVESYKLSQPQASDEMYYGITTKAMSAQIVSYDDNLGRAGIVVVTQRQETIGSTLEPKIFYQNIKLDLIKGNGGWKVDVAQWDKEERSL
jgi:hypothetical protein